MTEPKKVETAYFAGGCFWCVEAVFRRQKGVLRSISGYAGGATLEPSYEAVCTGETGHAETVKIDFDPTVVRYGELLEVFFRAHDPTTLNRQGADAGTQYRSAVFYTTEDQKQAAEKAVKQATKDFGRRAVTEIKPFTVFYQAEDYHQDYYAKNPGQGYCAVVIRPKLKKLGLE